MKQCLIRKEGLNAPSLKLAIQSYANQHKSSFGKQELRAHMALVTRREELRAKRSYGMSSNKIL